jgi:hypothetical protein
MSGVIVIANRATAARDILSGTIHKLTLWFDDVRRKPDMKMFLKEAVGRWDSGYGTERRLTKKVRCLSLSNACLVNPTRVTEDDRTREIEKRTPIGRRGERKSPSIDFVFKPER